MTNTLAADLRTCLMQAEEELSLAGRRLAWACYADGELVPADTALSLFPGRDGYACSFFVPFRLFPQPGGRETGDAPGRAQPFLP